MKALLKTPFPIGLTICCGVGGAIAVCIIGSILHIPIAWGLPAIVIGCALTYRRCCKELERLNLPLSTSIDDYQAIIRKS